MTIIGWYLLAALPSGFFGALSGTTLSGIFLDLLLSIPLFFVSAYVQTSLTVFYELVTEKLVVMEPDSGYDPDYVVPANYTVEENAAAPQPQDPEAPADGQPESEGISKSESEPKTAEPEAKAEPEPEMSGSGFERERERERDPQAEKDAKEEARYLAEERKYNDEDQ